MTTQDDRTPWSAYQEALGALYGGTQRTLVERGDAEIAAAPDLETRAQAVVERSRELGEHLAQGQEAADAGERELAQMQLLAAAACDLAVASDLARFADEGVPDDVRERGPALPEAVADLRAVLSAPRAGGSAGLVRAGLQPERAVGPSQPAAAREELHKTVEGALEDIVDDAAAVGQSAVKALLEMPLPPLKQAAGIAVHELLDKLGEVASAIVRRAALLVVEAIDKICRALGKTAQEQAKKQAASWIEDLKAGKLFGELLARLYETERIRQAVAGTIDGAPADASAERFNGAGQQASDLATRFRKQRQILLRVVQGLAWARGWILTLQPWGPIALTTAYLAGIGYIVYLGGDYVDWFRTGTSDRLNRVPGLRAVVDRALAEAQP